MTDQDSNTHNTPPAAEPLALRLSEGLGVSVGSTVWVFDMNRRVYRERKPGEVYAGGGPIWREHWAPRKVVGETARSWVLDWGGKVPKKGANPSLFAFSEEDINRRAWVQENRHKLAREVERCNDYETLLQVAEKFGFETPRSRQAAEGRLGRVVVQHCCRSEGMDETRSIEFPPESQATEALLRLQAAAHGGDALLMEAADEMAALRKEAERYRWLLSQIAGMKRADFFEPLRQHFYDMDEKYPDADDVQAAIDAAMLERVGVGAA